MTLSELIAKVTQIRPSEFDKDDLTNWLNELEFTVYDQVISHSIPEPMKPPDVEPVVVNPGEDNYIPPAEVVPVEEEEYRLYNYAEDAERTLLIPDQFASVYHDWLYAKIDFANGEIDRYNMEIIMFESDYQRFASWYRRTHKPKEVRHDTSLHKYSPLN